MSGQTRMDRPILPCPGCGTEMAGGRGYALDTPYFTTVVCCASCRKAANAIQSLAYSVSRFVRRCEVTDLAMTVFHTLHPHGVDQFRRALLALDRLAGMVMEGL